MTKKLLVTTVAVLGLAAYTYGQGTIQFNTSSVGTTAQVRDWNGNLIGSQVAPIAHTNFFAQLYAGTAGAGSASLTAVGNPVNFRRGTGAGYVQISGTTTLGWAVNTEVAIPGVAGGSPAQIQMRAWWGGATGTEYTTYEAAFGAGVPYGYSDPFTSLALGGAGSPPSTPPILTGLVGFTMVPEPSTLVLAGVGAAALLLFRRRK